MEVFFFSEFIIFVSVLLFLMLNLTFETKGVKFHFKFFSGNLISIWIEYAVYILIWYFFLLFINNEIHLTDFSLSYLQNDFLIFCKYFLSILFFIFLFFIKWFINTQDIYKGQELFFFLWMMFLGFVLMLSSKNFLLLFLSLECQSFAMYILIALRYKDRLATEAAMKYFLFGALSILLFLLGVCFFYYLFGTLDLEVIRVLSFTVMPHLSIYEKSILNMAVILLSCSFLLKLGLVPFHFWMPDVYNGTPLIVLFLFFLLPKAALILFMFYLFPVILQTFYDTWSIVFFVSGIFSVLIGSLLVIDQWKFKKLLIYSSIANMGYILLALAAGTTDIFLTCIFYLASYLINISVIFLILLFSFQSDLLILNIKSFLSFIKVYPFMALCFIINLFVSAGLPPFLFFYPKIFLIMQLVGGNIFSIFTLIFLIILTVISIFYYIRVVRYFFSLESEKNFMLFANYNIKANNYVFHYIIVLLTFLQVVFIFIGDEAFLFIFQNMVSF